ncbi:MAG: pectate lyase [Rhodothermales bacterium]
MLRKKYKLIREKVRIRVLPIFSGRDGVIKYELSEIERERRIGYRWYGTWPRELLEQEYPQWRANNNLLMQ